MIKEDNQFAIKKLIGTLYRNRWMIAGIVVCINLLGLLYLKLADNIYRVEALVLVDGKDNPSFAGDEFLEGYESKGTQRNVKNEMGVISSYALIREAVEQLPLRVSYITDDFFKETEHYPYFPYQVTADSSAYQLTGELISVEKISDQEYRLQIEDVPVAQYHYLEHKSRSIPEQIYSLDTVLQFGQPFIGKYLSFTLRQDDPQTSIEDFSFRFNNLNKMAEEYKGDLEVSLNDLEATIFKLSLEGTVPSKTTDVMSTICDLYINRSTRKSRLITDNTIQYIDEYLTKASDSLRQAKSSLERYRRQESLANIELATANAYERMRTLGDEKAQLEANLKYYESIARYLIRTKTYSGIVSPSAFGVDDPVLTELVLELKHLDTEMAGLSVKATQNSPQITSLTKKIENLKAAILESVDGNIASTRVAVADREERIQRVQAEMNRLPQQEQNLADLERQFTLSDNLYNYLQEKKAEAGILNISSLPVSELLDEPRVVGNEPIFPNKPLTIFITFFLSVVISGLVIAVRETFNSDISDREQIENELQYPILGSIGKQRGDIRAALHGDDLYIKNAFKELLVNIELQHEDKPLAVGITSTVSGEGKTYCSANLAATCASLGYRTLLLETDVYRPQLSLLFPYAKHIRFFNDYFEKNLPAREIIQSSELENLDIIFSKPSKDIHMKGSDKQVIEELFTYLKKQYDIIIVDSSPAGLVTDYFAIARFLDVNLFVLRQNYTKLSHIGEIKRVLSKAKFSKVGLVFNNVRTHPVDRYQNYYKPYQYH
ncbi:MAG: Wzz/FepE/Etk N-terminal domain-containing protein [Cyclobacteriaceae bacterium]